MPARCHPRWRVDRCRSRPEPGFTAGLSDLTLGARCAGIAAATAVVPSERLVMMHPRLMPIQARPLLAIGTVSLSTRYPGACSQCGHRRTVTGGVSKLA